MPYLVDGKWIFYIIISLKSDIWLPVVDDLKINVTMNSYEWLGAVDNRPLAYRHTPRLNSFLRDIKQLVINNNGRWVFECDGEIIQTKTNMRLSETEQSDKLWCDHAIPLDGKIIFQEDIR